MSEALIHELTMPKWGLTMEEGTVVEWLLDEGDVIEIGTEIIEIETDKLTQAVESTVVGLLRRKIGEEGEAYPVKELIGIIADTSISDADIDEYIAQHEAKAVPGSEVENEVVTPLEVKAQTELARIPISAMRGAIANTVVSSWTVPQFPVTMAIDMGAAKTLRNNLKAAGTQVSMNDIVIKACAKALAQNPMVNATLGSKEYIINPEVNIAVAVGLDEGLMMPVIKGCQALSLTEIAVQSREMIDKVKAGTADQADLTGGNFAISNMGMFGIEQFAALVPPNMSAILAVGGIKDEVVIKDDNMVPASMMRVTLAADHRVVDGLSSAKYLVELKRLLENPNEL